MGVRTVAAREGRRQDARHGRPAIIVPEATTSDRIQEYIKILHIAIEAVERAVFPENY